MANKKHKQFQLETVTPQMDEAAVISIVQDQLQRYRSDIRLGGGTNVMGLKPKEGLHIGNGNFDDSPFRVNTSGEAIARSFAQQERFTAGESVPIRSSVAIATAGGTQINLLTLGAASNGTEAIQANVKFAQLIPGDDKDYDTATINIPKTGSPTDSIRVSIQTDDSGDPDGIPIASKTILGSSLASGSNDFRFDTYFTLVSGTNYHVVVERTGDTDVSNYFSVSAQAGDPYAPSDMHKYNGSSWSLWNAGFDMYIHFDLTTQAGVAYKADSDVAELADAYIGQSYAADAILADGTRVVDVLISGVQSGYSGLAPGSTYYVNAAPGSIGTSAGSNSKKVGVATAADRLYILPTV